MNLPIPVYIFLLLLNGAAYGQSIQAARATDRSNIVFIAIDDLRPELGCYGNTFIKTPNIDSLGAHGRVFLKHYVNVPTCGPSRYCLLTGTYPRGKEFLRNEIFETTTAINNDTRYPESLIELFRREGYYTAGMGKISHAADGKIYGYNEVPSGKPELPHSWDEFVFNAGQWKTGWGAFFGYADGDNRNNLKGNVRPYEAANVEDEGYPDGLTANLAVQTLQKLKKTNKPFFLAVGFFKPHLPFNAPKRYWDLYDEDLLPVADNQAVPLNVSLESLTNSEEFRKYKLGEEKPTLQNRVSDAYARKLRHAYFAAVSYSDAQVGKIMRALKALELDKNTIVVIWGDNGWHLGDEMVWGKHTLSEYSLHTPLIIAYPGIPFPGKASKAVVQSVDIYPTLLQLANLHKQTSLDGLSLCTQLTDPFLPDTSVAYGYFKNGITLRTDRYRLTKYYRPGHQQVELYDYNIDPFETKNIAEEQPFIVDSLMPLLQKGNTGLYQQP